MAHRRTLLPRQLPQGLAAVTLLLASLQWAFVLSMPTAQDAASSILSGSNGTVPDFVTRHGMDSLPQQHPRLFALCDIVMGNEPR